MTLKVATVFSGIGAIEHSLERMGIEHEIVFACDNSNIDWSEKLTKTAKMVNSSRNPSTHSSSRYMNSCHTYSSHISVGSHNSCLPLLFIR